MDMYMHMYMYLSYIICSSPPSLPRGDGVLHCHLTGCIASRYKTGPRLETYS